MRHFQQPSPFPLLRILTLIGATLSLPAVLTAQGLENTETRVDETAASAWEPVIVLTEDAQVFRGNEPGPKLPPGSITYISTRNGEWLLVPRYNSWIHQKHVLALPAALQSLNEQISKQPNGPLHHYRGIVNSELGRAEPALQDFAEAIKLGVDSASVYLNRGLAWQRSGHRANALDDFNKAIGKDANDPQAYFNRGVLHIEMEQPKEAMLDFNAAIRADPKFAEAYNNRGLLLQERGDLADALANFNHAIKLRPRFPAALTNRAFLHQEQGEWAEAIEDYAAALKMAPDSHPTLNDLAWVLATCPQRDDRNGEFAMRYAERANELTGGRLPDYLDTLAAALAEAGDFDRAVTVATQAIELTEMPR
ncbi:MAG: tetratricopeptide repeat protein [Planctomycetaceae bacterium]